MPLFNYTARDKNGTEITGTIDAINESAARDALQSIELEPIFLQDRSSTFVPKEPIETVVIANAPSPEVTAKQWEVLEPVKPPENNIYKNVQPIHENWTTFKEDEAYESKDVLPVLPADSLHYKKEVQKQYYPLSETIRLYAGWLLAWYGLVYALAHFERTRQPAPAIPYVSGLLYSQSILNISVACFLYLFVHTIIRRYSLNIGTDALLFCSGIISLFVYIVYT